MTRLFLTLYLLLVAALVCYWFIAESMPNYLLKPIQLNYAHQNYQGTRHLLERRVSGLSGKELELAVNEIQQQFELSWNCSHRIFWLNARWMVRIREFTGPFKRVWFGHSTPIKLILNTIEELPSAHFVWWKHCFSPMLMLREILL